MDSDNQPNHERRLSKLSGSSAKLKQHERNKDNCVATLGPNHPALAMGCFRGLTTKIALSAPLGVRASPRRPQDASAINPTALFTQQEQGAEMTLPNPCVILNLDEAMDNASKNKASSDDSLLSDMLSIKVGGDNPQKGATLTDVEEQFDPLPDNYLFTYSATGDKPPRGDDEFDKPIDLSDKQVSKFTFVERLVHYMDGNHIFNCN
jgi:hypothetical protein